MSTSTSNINKIEHYYLPYLRTGMASSAVVKKDAIRPTVDVEFNISSTATIGELEPQSKTSKINVSLYGPGDVLGFNERIVSKTQPIDQIGNFNASLIPYIEFIEADFLWRYSAKKDDKSDKYWIPWLSLIVLKDKDKEEAGEFNYVSGGNPELPRQIELTKNAVLPDLEQSWRWAHVHLSEVSGLDKKEIKKKLRQSPHQAVSRLLCPRRLKMGTKYTAFVIPTYVLGMDVALGRNSEATTNSNAVLSNDIKKLAYYFKWEFRTGHKGGFEYLIKQLKFGKLQNLGIRSVGASNTGYPDISTTTDIKLEGALRSTDTVYPEWGYDSPDPQDSEKGHNDLGELLNKKDKLVPPIYGKWFSENGTGIDKDKNKKGWINELNLDLRHRYAAGLGAQVIRDNQEELMKSAWQQLSEVKKINSVLNQAKFGLEVSNCLYKRLEELSDDKALLIGLPLQSKVLTSIKKTSKSATSKLGAGAKLTDTGSQQSPNHQSQTASTVHSQLKTRLNEYVRQPKLKKYLGRKFNKQIKSQTVTTPTSGSTTTQTLTPVLAQGLTMPTLSGGEGTGSVTATPIQHPDAGEGGVRTQPLNTSSGGGEASVRVQRSIFGQGGGEGQAGTKKSVSNNSSGGEGSVETQSSGSQSSGGEGGSISKPHGNQSGGGEGGSVGKPSGNQSSGEEGSISKPSDKRPSGGEGGFTDNESVAEKVTSIKKAGKAIKQAINPTTTIEKRLVQKIKHIRNWEQQEQEKSLEVGSKSTANSTRSATNIASGARATAGSASDTIVNNLNKQDPLRPFILYPEFHIPMYRYLRDKSQQLLLPGLENIAPNTVSLLTTNTRFIEAFMVGLNHEFAAELRWREYPTDLRGTYFRKFWDTTIFSVSKKERIAFKDSIVGNQLLKNLKQRYLTKNIDITFSLIENIFANKTSETPNLTDKDISAIAKAYEEAIERWLLTSRKDINSIASWDKDSELGENTIADNAAGESDNQVVLLIRGDILNKFPSIRIYLTSTESKDINPIFPIFEANLPPDIVLLGFPITDEKYSDYLLVFEEPVSEVQYGLDEDDAPKDPVDAENVSWQHFKKEKNEGLFVGEGEYLNSLTPNIIAKDPTVDWNNPSFIAKVFTQKSVRLKVPLSCFITKSTKNDFASGGEGRY